MLGTVAGPLRIGVHPDDAGLVRRMFTEDEELSKVRVEEDPSLSRGGCTLATDHSFIDATVETRIARLAVQLLGDERGAQADPVRDRTQDSP
jgi:flagellar assembly protein FliH